MLTELRVQNFAIIENLHVQFFEGFNVLTGETGAGKSVLLKSLSLLMGEKSQSDSVRHDQEFAVVEGVFDLSHREDVLKALKDLHLFSDEPQMVIRRVVSANGKNKVYINGSLCNLSTLQTLVSPLVEVSSVAAPLIEMTGQFDQQQLLERKHQLQLIDLYSHHQNARSLFQEKFQVWKALEIQLEQLHKDELLKEQRLDYLKFQIQEIEDLDLQVGDEVVLEQTLLQIRNRHRVVEVLDSIETVIGSDSMSGQSFLSHLKPLQLAVKEFKRFASEDLIDNQKIEALTDLIHEISFQIQKKSKQYREQTFSEDAIEEKLSQLRRLQKKFGQTAAEILDAKEAMITEMRTLEQSEEQKEKLKKEINQLTQWLKVEATRLHAVRTKKSSELSDLVNKELRDLEMNGVIFEILSTETSTLNENGKTLIQFMIKNGASAEPKFLSKIASGGELSRILLALKKTLGSSDKPRTLLFDEIDAGVSGKTAEKIGKKLKALSKSQQLICVTHLSQVALHADHHFFIKKVSGQKEDHQTQIKNLSYDQRVHEIARLISGEKLTRTSLTHARSLLEACQ